MRGALCVATRLYILYLAADESISGWEFLLLIPKSPQKAVNPCLSLLKEISVVNKVKFLGFQKAKQISRKHLPAAQRKFWKEKLDTFFDISSCSCNLPILSCDNINVKCTKENCQTKHIICTCPLTKKPTKKYEDIPTNSFNIICSGWFFPFLLIFSKWWNRGL